ncbi:elongation factor Tu, putative [Plasmodium knowlesi strain H]|uniref:Elongation factor Tu, putative n=3 Tax=Plasmodium knowlesi TaxID=5850 RepID=A0A5K1UUA3_PLAKH|nr:elongation factor Tu, putative [Plasmodium knowlesi strain H]OTN66192.1 putative Elongation factor Tu [Plasmodium knowlesi]CAA9989851.1 elongation factor Tu, putative [Plasmodium knowlesi strain H]SBO24404.1 elongation factor Tu, putative [Plasmodium knowlesi strain H]SBO26607.1 elongation factor Tu, putative [Plasmodium knowlesi strain H]VVS79325.1 elongation factor Tu, putative [Plasmodium knowlesi strain H]|eukprot:XP_002259866.1 elongation factor Tu, putative [Plasmodium knowlesi strain H]
MDLVKYLNQNERVRNICILAHVDHGKTTLVDNLISSNKIISDKNIGKVKYLDNREDEQKRQITMKSSSILLKHTYNKAYLDELFRDRAAEQKSPSGKDMHAIGVEGQTAGMTISTTDGEQVKPSAGPNGKASSSRSVIKRREGTEVQAQADAETANAETANAETADDRNIHLINIIDTPGHVDFSSEVSTCIRICDGALILVDCIEGMCSQTKIVLRQTWKEMIKSILVINKIDKLITNQNMDSVSAYEHINNIIEQVNAYIYQLYMEENMDKENVESSELEKYTYSPLKGNVLLCSSTHCWCIDMNIFSTLFCKKMNINVNNAEKIKKYMWNQYYFNTKEKKILKMTNDTTSTYQGNTSSGKKKKKNLFSLVVLDFLWKIYDITTINRDDEQIKKLCLELNISNYFLKKNQQNNVENNTFILIYIMSHFLNLSRSIFNSCIEIFPSPKNMNTNRLFKIYPSLYNEDIYRNITECSSTSDFTIIYISKYICANVQNNTLVGFRGFYDKNTFLSICRIYSGILYENMFLYICGRGIKTVVKKIYICMGGDLLPIGQAYAGNIVAVYLSIVHVQDPHLGGGTGGRSCNDNHPRKNAKREDNSTSPMGEDHIPTETDNIMNKSGIYPQEIQTASHTEHANPNDMPLNIDYHGGGKDDLQYLSNTLMNLIKNKRSKKQHNIFIMNSDGFFLNKNITLSSDPNADSFILPFTDTCSTILHTIIEPKNIQDMNKFLYGLILLYTCDTSIDIDFNERGEYILKFCGEIHMQKCLSDFVNIYSNIEIKTSDTNISIREGIQENTVKVKRRKNKVHESMKDLHTHYMQITMGNQVKGGDYCITAAEGSEDTNNKNILDSDNGIIEGAEKIPLLNTADDDCERSNCNNSRSFKNERGDNHSASLFRHIHLEKDNYFLNILFNYTHNTICQKLNNNSFYVFLSVLNMPPNLLNFFDKHYSNIQAVLENRSISPSFLNYGKTDLCSTNEQFMYKQCLINLERYINDLCFSEGVNCGETMEEKSSSATGADATDAGKSHTNDLSDVNCFGNVDSVKEGPAPAPPCIGEKANQLRRNKNYQLELWDVCVQNGSVTLLYIKKYFSKKKNDEYMLDNIITNEKYKKIINQRSFVDTYLSDTNSDINIYLNNLCLGFKMASKYGPIAQEPIRGALFIIEGLIIDEVENGDLFEDVNPKEENNEWKINPGNIIALMKEACLNAVVQNTLRIYEPMLRLNLTCESNVLGKVYNVLLKRRCSILSEEIKDGYFLYCIDAYLPLFNSFKLAEELRSKCSGNVIYDIQFSHWNKLNEDIFLSNDSSTVIYDEDFDVKLMDNTATEIVNFIRRAKGLETNEKIIQKPEKQCTLKK